METNKEILLNFINKSFISEYLKEGVTDITYNGEYLFVENSLTGKVKINKEINNELVGNFLAHLANISGKNFNSLNPILDISFLNYRLNAMHPLIAKKNNKGVYTFALRIYSQKVMINSSSNDFCPIRVHELLKRIIKKRKSVLICGKTGVGKTEFQKYLVGYMDDNTKIVLIEDLYETFLKEIYPKLDIVSWVSFDNQKELVNEYEKLIKAALRNNPDWLMIAEVRGKEAKELFNAFTTGHPFIATIHAKNASLCLKRFVQMMDENIDNQDLFLDLAEYIPFSILLNKKIVGGKVKRYIESIVENVVIDNKVVYQEIYNSRIGLCLNKLSKKNKKELGYKEEK